jgi:hypothetical protein
MKVVAVLLVCVACASEEGATTQPDVGAELACRAMAANHDSIASDALDGELGSESSGQLGKIIGYASSADDAVLQSAAEAFNEGPDREAAFERIAKRCRKLGITEP